MAAVKIIGDALNALFGAPTDQDDHAARRLPAPQARCACRGACAMRAGPQSDQRASEERGLAPDGNFGGAVSSTTPHGDTINIAARLSGQQTTWHPHLHQRQRGRAHPRFPRRPGQRGSCARELKHCRRMSHRRRSATPSAVAIWMRSPKRKCVIRAPCLRSPRCLDATATTGW